MDFKIHKNDFRNFLIRKKCLLFGVNRLNLVILYNLIVLECFCVT